VRKDDVVTLRFLNDSTQHVTVSRSADGITIGCYEPVVLLNSTVEFDMSLP
jgi:hypothetical protein